jgi:small subunit ribosomal protein S17
VSETKDQLRGGRAVEGRVVSSTNDKTRVIAVDQRFAHARYGRSVNRTTKFVAHDELNKSAAGDLVRIRECRPLSRTKRWRVIEIIEKAPNE